jgi:hypothetical protein
MALLELSSLYFKVIQTSSARSRFHLIVPELPLHQETKLLGFGMVQQEVVSSRYGDIQTTLDLSCSHLMVPELPLRLMTQLSDCGMVVQK